MAGEWNHKFCSTYQTYFKSAGHIGFQVDKTQFNQSIRMHEIHHVNPIMTGGSINCDTLEILHLEEKKKYFTKISLNLPQYNQGN